MRGVAVQIPLNTSDPRQARAIAAAATAASASGFDALHAGLIDRAALRGMIERAARVEAAKQTLRGERMFFFPFPYEPPASMRSRGFQDDEIARFICEREAATDDDLRGWSADDVAEYHAFRDGRLPASREEAPAAVSVATASHTVIIHNHAAAPPRADTAPAHTKAPDPAPSSGEATSGEASGDGRRGKGGEAPDRKRHKADAPSRTRIADLVTRVNAAERKRGKINEDSAGDFVRCMNLFCEISGIDHVEDITQARISDFVDTLDLLPRSYRKSEAERLLPIWDIINAAELDGCPLGLSASTINKNLTQISKLIKFANSYGIPVSPKLETSLLRISDKQAKRDKRAAFTHDDLVSIFSQPALALDAKRDALFWIAHACAYTGARREEIAALDAADIIKRDGVHCIHIRDNPHRTVKTGQSWRVIPLHRDLVRLGLHDLARDRRGHMLFEIRRKSRASSFGDSIDYRWRQAMHDAIGAGQRKSFHSMRHSAVQSLINAGVDVHLRSAIFGHLVGHIEGDVYGGAADIVRLHDAVNLIPSVR